MIELLKMTQPQLKRYLVEELREFGYTPISADGFIYAEGRTKIGLVAHMDTVCVKPPKWVNIRDGVLSNADHRDCLGADDRAGIYAILHLIRSGLQPTIIITEDEEIGCIGAGKFAKVGIESDVKYLIELDRMNSNDCVFYDNDNEDFMDYIESFGYVTSNGSFSDICEIAPQLGVSAVNLSVGYYHQHTSREILVLDELYGTIRRVFKMLLDAPDMPFVYESYYSSDRYLNSKYYGWSSTYNDAMYGDSYSSKTPTRGDVNNSVAIDVDGTTAGIILEDCWINYMDAEANFEYLDGSELIYISKDNVIYDVSGEVLDAILLDDSYEQVDYNYFVGKMLDKFTGSSK